ncbi:MAG: tRNA (adenosine(37)-N6)-threonylcarbamoyltransferase complex dimerization subunit type 1 TsaB [Candidatus Kapaibacterium sp.]
MRNIILCLESSDNTCGVALIENNIILAANNYYSRNLHDRLMADNIKYLFDNLNIDINQLNAVAVSSGPGSFTGLRISAAIAKGLCFDNTVKFIAIPNGEAFAYSALDFAKSLNKEKIVCLINCNSSEIYYQEFDVLNFNCTNIELIEKSKLQQRFDQNYLYIGTAVNQFEFISSKGFFDICKSDYIAALAIKYFNENKFTDASDYQPNYIKEFIPKSPSKILNI